MFNCYVHGWSHGEKPCPLCHPEHTYISSGTGITIHAHFVNEISADEIEQAARDYADSRAFIAGVKWAVSKMKGGK